MLPDGHPIMRHYDAEKGTRDPELRPDPDDMPEIDAEAVRSCNQFLRRKAGQSPGSATVYAGYCFRKALQHCSKDERLLEETAALLFDLFLSSDRVLAVRDVLLAAEQTEAGQPSTRHRICIRASRSKKVRQHPQLLIRCLEQLGSAAEEMWAEDPEQWQLLVEAQLRKADFHLSNDELEQAHGECEDAIGLIQFFGTIDDHVHLHVRGLHGIAQALIGRGEVAEAEEILVECQTRLRKVCQTDGAHWSRERLCRVLLDRAEIAASRDDQRHARRHLDGAAELLRHASGMTGYACRMRIAALAKQVGRPRVGRAALFELSGTEFMLAAGSTGYEDVAELAKLEAEDEGASWIAESRPEVQQQASLHRRRLRDAERLLNTDSDLVDERIRGLECALKHTAPDHDEPESADLRSLLTSWRALRVIREMAAQVCCKRGMLPGDWGQGFPAEPQVFAGCRFTAYELTTSEEGPDAYEVVADVKAHAGQKVDPIPDNRRTVVEAVAELHDRISEWQKDPSGSADRKLIRWSFTFQDFSRDQLNILQSFHNGAELARYEVGPGRGRAGLQGCMPDLTSSTRAEVGCSEESSTRERGGLTIRQRDVVTAGGRLRRRVAQTLELLMNSLAIKDAPKLHRCPAPPTKAYYYEWRLEERDDLPTCGNFYFSDYKKRRACYRTHSNRVSELRSNASKHMWETAREIAENEFNEHAEPGDVFLTLWEDATADSPKDPAAALTRFRELISVD